MYSSSWIFFWDWRQAILHLSRVVHSLTRAFWSSPHFSSSSYRAFLIFVVLLLTLRLACRCSRYNSALPSTSLLSSSFFFLVFTIVLHITLYTLRSTPVPEHRSVHRTIPAVSTSHASIGRILRRRRCTLIGPCNNLKTPSM